MYCRDQASPGRDTPDMMFPSGQYDTPMLGNGDTKLSACLSIGVTELGLPLLALFGNDCLERSRKAAESIYNTIKTNNQAKM